MHESSRLLITCENEAILLPLSSPSHCGIRTRIAPTTGICSKQRIRPLGYGTRLFCYLYFTSKILSRALTKILLIPSDFPIEAKQRMTARTTRNGGKKTWMTKEKIPATVIILTTFFRRPGLSEKKTGLMKFVRS